MAEEPKCSQRIPQNFGYPAKPCSRKGVVKFNGHPYCRQHAPDLREARDAARHEAWKARRDHQNSQEREEGRRAAKYPQLLSAIETVAARIASRCDSEDNLSADAREDLRILRAAIAEAKGGAS